MNQSLYNSAEYNSSYAWANAATGATPDTLNKIGLKAHNFDNVVIPMNPEWTKVGINLSGGADSAIMAFLMATTIKDNNYNCKIEIITFVRNWFTRPWQSTVSTNVYKWLKNRFPDIITHQVVTYLPPELEHGAIGNIHNGRSMDQIMVGSFNKYLAVTHQYNACYNATTKNPTVGYEIFDRMMNRDNIEQSLNSLAYIADDTTSWSLTPLRLTEKDWVIRQYVNHDILELLYITRSCEGDSNTYLSSGMNFTWYTQNPDAHIPECGKCFWCVERNWAIEKVGLHDR